MKKPLFLIAFFISAVAFSGCLPQQAAVSTQDSLVEEKAVQDEIMEESTQEGSLQEGDQEQETQKEYSFIAEENGQTAFAVLEKNLELDYKDYDFGVFIEGINGLKADKDYYWAFYVNGEYAEKGSKQTVLQKDDIVTMKYEEVKEY